MGFFLFFFFIIFSYHLRSNINSFNAKETYQAFSYEENWDNVLKLHVHVLLIIHVQGITSNFNLKLVLVL